MGVARNVLNWYAKLSPSRGRVKPPYSHVVQIGDPTLRNVSEPVSIENITSPEIQKVVNKLEHVLNKYGSLGMSAPQVGINLRIFAMQHSKQQISLISKETIARHGLTVIPFTVFINPKMKIKDYQKVICPEGCESVRGFSADVPRYREVEITGYNTQGEPTSQTFKDWAARIVQHELDHLDGRLYTDIMDRKTLQCNCWEEVNLSQGKLAIPFYPD